MRPFLLTLALAPALQAAVSFEKQVLTEEFVAEGASVADFNGDGKMDVAAGPYIWFGPKFTTRINIRPTPNVVDPKNGYSDVFLSSAADLDGDGKVDIIQMGYPGTQAVAYLNPGKKDAPWTKRLVFEPTDGECPALIQITGDARPELLCFSGGSNGYVELAWGKEDKPGTFHPVSKVDGGLYQRYTHGQGAGDVNGDKRVDILDKTGWFEQPAKAGDPWTFHPANFGEGGAQMLVYDVNGDGRNDVVTSIQAHGYGISWFEQNKDGTFAERKILQQDTSQNPGKVNFSQPHALTLGDINGDGIPDFVSGKRRWAHNEHGDPEPNADPVLYWFETKRDGRGGAKFIPHEIDRASGVGNQVDAVDVNGDRKIDVVVANKSGVFVFIQK
jgi:hypothetical protein